MSPIFGSRLRLLVFNGLLIIVSSQEEYCRDEHLTPKQLPGFTESGIYHNTVKSLPLPSLMFCLGQCIQHDGCDMAVMCNMMDGMKLCFLVSGNVFNIDLPTYDFTDCQAITMANCKNGGTYFGEMCHCLNGFTGSNCQLQTPDYCHSRTWKTVLSRTSTGDVISGNNADLKSAVENGDFLKVMIDKGKSTSAMYSLYTSRTLSAGTWAMPYEDLEIDLLDKAESSAWRQNLDIQAAEDVISYWNYTLDLRQEAVNNSNKDLDWYAVSYTNSLPCMVTDANDHLISGSIASCFNILRNGGELYLAELLTCKAETVTSDGSSISVNLPLALGHGGYPVLTIINPAYWFHMHLRTDGADMFRWYVHQHRLRYKDTGKYDFKWFVDECWHQAFSHTSSGSSIYGSKEYLEAAVRNGKQLRVHTGDSFSLLHDVRIKDGDVTGIMHEVFNKTGTTNDGQRDRTMVSTSGMMTSCSFLFESEINTSWWETRGTINWFVDSRFWVRTLSFNQFGRIIFGYKEKLIEEVSGGKSVRIVITNPDDSVRSVTIRNINFLNSTYVVLKTGVQQTVLYKQDSWVCQQWAGFLYTDGVYETVKWTTDTKFVEPRTTQSYKRIDVFVQS